MTRAGAAVLLVFFGGCGWLGSLGRHTAPAPATTFGAVAEPTRPRPYPVFETQGFARAVDRGTRTRTGQPGPSYWQQYARYRIEAELMPWSGRLTGRAHIRYLNNSPDTLPEVWLHLYPNLFAPNAIRNTFVPVTGGMEVLRVAAQNTVLSRRETGEGFLINSTRMRVQLPRAMMPRDSVDLEIEWAFTVPPDGAPRMGSTGDAFMLAYWYPQVAVYDDVVGWQVDPYLGNAEFYMGYGDYDVALTMPAGWLIGATGDLANADQVLSPQTRERLADARATGYVTPIVRDGDRGPGRATARGLDNRLTWRFRARNVRDFAWAASDRYVWNAAGAIVEHGRGPGRPDTVLVHTLFRPEAREHAWEHAAHFSRHSVEFLSRYLWPYPYSQMTVIDGPASCGGMEYPMITCIGGPRDTLSLYSVINHEIGHMWFPMSVGSDEKRHSWQDEGLTRFNQAQAMQAFFRGYDREAISREAYLSLARTDAEEPMMRHGDQYAVGSRSFVVASYEKPAAVLVALRALLGPDVFLRAYREYGRAWEGKHPTPFDFFNSFNASAGRDLSWFWRTWWYETWTLDQAIGDVREDRGRLVVTIEDRGLAPMPVRLAITRSTGPIERREVPVDVWLAGARRHVVTIDNAATVTAIEIDPEQAFPDVDRTNNRWARR